jgi:hypothetical protein
VYTLYTRPQVDSDCQLPPKRGSASTLDCCGVRRATQAPLFRARPIGLIWGRVGGGSLTDSPSLYTILLVSPLLSVYHLKALQLPTLRLQSIYSSGQCARFPLLLHNKKQNLESHCVSSEKTNENIILAAIKSCLKINE